MLLLENVSFFILNLSWFNLFILSILNDSNMTKLK